MANNTNPIALDDTLRATNQKLDSLKSVIESSYTNPTSYRTTDSTTTSIADSDYIPIATIGTQTTRKKTLVSTLQEKFWQYVATKLSTVATTGSYNDLSNKPTIPSAQVQTDWDAESGISSIANKPSLSDVATSGSYNDLSDKPTIPTVQYGYSDSPYYFNGLNNVVAHASSGSRCKYNINDMYQSATWYIDISGSQFVTNGLFEKYKNRVFLVGHIDIRDSSGGLIFSNKMNFVCKDVEFVNYRTSNVYYVVAKLHIEYLTNNSEFTSITVQDGTDYTFNFRAYLP